MRVAYQRKRASAVIKPKARSRYPPSIEPQGYHERAENQEAYCLSIDEGSLNSGILNIGHGDDTVDLAGTKIAFRAEELVSNERAPYTTKPAADLANQALLSCDEAE